MDIQECNTIKECLYWAEGEWPGFWDFANLNPMMHGELLDLADNINEDDRFDQFLARLRDVYETDDSPEAPELLLKGARAFTTLERRLNEYSEAKRPNKNR